MLTLRDSGLTLPDGQWGLRPVLSIWVSPPLGPLSWFFIQFPAYLELLPLWHLLGFFFLSFFNLWFFLSPPPSLKSSCSNFAFSYWSALVYGSDFLCPHLGNTCLTPALVLSLTPEKEDVLPESAGQRAREHQRLTGPLSLWSWGGQKATLQELVLYLHIVKAGSVSLVFAAVLGMKASPHPNSLIPTFHLPNHPALTMCK